MANEENKQSGTNQFTGLLTVLVLFFSAVWVDYAPLKTSRPQPEEIPEITQTGVKARLWQAPFTAVQRELAKPLTKLREGIFLNKLPGDVLQDMMGKKDKDTKIIALGVMIQEANWESVEELQGRRHRYAVLAALNHLGYVPDDAEKLQCLEITGTNVKPDSLVILTAENQNPLTTPYERFTKTDPLTIPYEQFTNTDPDTKKPRVILFWLNELAFKHKPLASIRELFGSSLSDTVSDAVKIRIIGPWASGTVKDLVDEAQNLVNKPSSRSQNSLMFLSSSATAPDKFLLPAEYRLQALPEFLKSKGVFLERVTSTDDKIVRSLVKELALRGLDKKSLKANEAYVALISEWDTLYAQTLPQIFKSEFEIQDQCTKGSVNCPILQYSYLRGLDGLLPGKREANADRQGKNNKETEKKGATIEQPQGDSQIDYLRRLTDRLYDQERRLKDQGKELKAIGVFGNDIYDKLMVLEALRVRFPGKVLFTTDLDAAYLHPDEFKSVTHNLVVGSAFGLTLNPYLQGSIPPFRDSYQTGTFLAIQMALSMDQLGRSIEKPDQRIEVHNKIAQWFPEQSSRIFEIGRTRAVSLNDPEDGQSDPCSSIADCQSVHPASGSKEGESSYYRAKLFHLAKFYIGVLILLTLLWLLLCLLWRGARQMTRNAWRWLRYHPSTGVILFTVLLALVVSMNYLAFFRKGEEPFSWVEGVSMWPAELIRITTLLLAIVLFRRGWLLIRLNDFVVSKRFFPDTWRVAMVARAPAKQSLPDTIKNYWQELVRPDKYDPQSPLEIWAEHIHPQGFSAQLLHAFVPAVVFVFFGFILLNLVGPPERPYRGDVFGRLDFAILFSTLFAIQVLIFFVAESTARCNRMAQQLKKAPNWSEATLAAFELTNCSAMEHSEKITRKTHYDRLFDPLLDMRLIAERTAVLSGLIYYPFLVLALFIASRTRLFDNWCTPWQLALRCFSFCLSQYPS
ncbi:MAG: hypothetical protein PHD43_01985 [Methylococcales bacterium]|nr:hypothetical protein [Methylococcales bacterium]